MNNCAFYCKAELEKFWQRRSAFLQEDPGIYKKVEPLNDKKMKSKNQKDHSP